MEPIQIVLIVLVAAGIWSVVELALTIRRARTTVDTLDKTMNEVNEAIGEARPVIAKLDGVVDDLQPALSQVEPLLKQGSVAIEALSADLIEINGVLRDVSQVTGTVSTASDAVSGIADAATEKVQRLLGKKHRTPSAKRALSESAEPKVADVSDALAAEDADARADTEPAPFEAPANRYFTYSDGTAGEDSND